MSLATDELLVNDVHSRLNPTRVAAVDRPRDVDDLRRVIRRAADRHVPVAVCGGRHAMGGQQFASDALLIDMTNLTAVLDFDARAGLIEMEAGAQWPQVIAATHEHGGGRWGIRQKQTGADALTLGGAAAANVHGRGLLMRPFVDDIESLKLITADGQLLTCSRTQHAELFSLAVGGYGLFGVIASVTLRLGPRLKLRRLVDILDIDDAIPAVRRRVSEGCLYGDFQYAIDPADDSFLRRGVCACYTPVADDVPVSDDEADLREDDWLRLLKLAHTDKRRAFQIYSAHYLATHGRVYWSDTMQLSTYIPSYDQFLKQAADDNDNDNDAPRRDTAQRGTSAAPPRIANTDESLIIGELFIPPDALVDFLAQARQVLRETGVEDIYGTIRSILRDDVTFLPWARDDFACVIFNLRTPHTPAGVDRSARAFRGLHDAALRLGGGFYLTYHRFATADQVERAYPNFRAVLAKKREYDADGRFTSDWHRHYAEMFT